MFMLIETRQWKRRGIIRRFGQWAVTQFGLENLSGPCSYEVGYGQLGQVWWSDHMCGKNWVDGADFDAALRFARKHFGVKVGGGVLW